MLPHRCQHQKQPWDHPVTLPCHPWLKDRAHVLGCLQAELKGWCWRMGLPGKTGGTLPALGLRNPGQLAILAQQAHPLGRAGLQAAALRAVLAGQSFPGWLGCLGRR